MESLGHKRYAVVGHDRGARVAHRLALDYPDAVTRLCVLDIVPTHTVFRDAGKELAAAYWHWFFFLTPDLPELMLGAVPEAFLRHMFRALTARAGAIEEPMLQEYLRAFTSSRNHPRGPRGLSGRSDTRLRRRRARSRTAGALPGAGDLGRVRQDAYAVRRTRNAGVRRPSTCAAAHCPAAISFPRKRRTNCWRNCGRFSPQPERPGRPCVQPTVSADLHYSVRTAGVSGGLIDVESTIANEPEAPLKSKLVAIVPLLGLSLFAYAGPQEQTFTEITPGSEAVNPDNLIPLVGRGDVRAINNIGLLWARGVGVSGPNFTEALHWWKEAAKRGYPVSMNNIGLLYANGHGVPQDYKEALKWWRMAAERGNAWAMNSIGDLYENGQGVQQSYPKAIDWYGRAAEAGDGLAMYNLGALYENGRGVEQSFKTAYDWYSRSAERARERHAQPGEDVRGRARLPGGQSRGTRMAGGRRTSTMAPRTKRRRRPTSRICRRSRLV